MDQQDSSASPARQAAKRRHTAAFASEDIADQKQGVKRAKTLKTYGSSRRQLEAVDNDDFEDVRNDRDHVSPTSQPAARFSEHSGHHSSMPLPTESLEVDFLNHEPAVLFKDSGDTVADASSDHRRMLDQAIASKTGPSAFLTKEARANLEQHSSSIPWTASEVADSAKSKNDEAVDQADDHATDDRDEAQGLQTEASAANEEQRPPAGGEAAGLEAADLRHNAKHTEFSLRRPKCSPTIEIPWQASSKSSNDQKDPKPSRRASNNRKCKAEEAHNSSEPLNSDDRAIGLPNERYQPALGRRRGTQVTEDTIGYGVIPGKAAKAKRTKTTGANTGVVFDQERLGAYHDRQDIEPSGPGKGAHTESEPIEDTAQDTTSLNKQAKDTDAEVIKPHRTIEHQDGDDQPELSPTTKYDSKEPESPTVPAQANEDEIFVKPAMPTPKQKNETKRKRAQTTIFEDHVEFTGSRKSPNLSQQQEKRKSALQDVQNEAVPKPQRKRTSVVAGDSDDEDELAKENDTIASRADSAPNKRRGRPPKAEKQASRKANNSNADDLDGEVEGNDEAEVEQPGDDDPPKKRGRGRPAKARDDTRAGEKADTADETQTAEILGKSTDDQIDTARPASQLASTTAKQATPVAKIPTPSPEKITDEMALTPQKPTSSTAQHSPIKSSSKVPLRVGLSKKHRIPSLLRFTRPAKR